MTKSGGDGLIVELRHVGGADTRYVDADRSRLSKPLAEPGEQPPDLVLRDLADTPITSLSPSTDCTIQLTIARDRDNYLVSLDYRLDKLDEPHAIGLITEFTERLGEPLLHIL